MTIAIGQNLGRYRIDSILGRGGMAVVYRARDESLDRDVAVKVILPDLTAESLFLQRFETEAKLVASLDHPNILPIFDFGEHDGQPYVVMPFIPGGTLAERLERLRAEGRGVPLPTALDWSLQIASALDAAHQAGVLHRDVKPGNILVGREDRLFLADFGIARLYDATARLTRTGTVVGTPLYMAPEVAAGANAGTASDLYSLAVIVYEMLAGKPPFEGENLLAILNQHATRPVPPLTDHDPRMPAQIDGALARGLAKKPEERPPSCTEFVTLLRSGVFTAAGLPGDLVSTTAKTLPLSSSAALTAAPLPPTAGNTVPPGTGSFAPARQWAMAGLVGAVVALAGFFLLRMWEPRATPDPPMTETAALAVEAGAEEHARPPLPGSEPGLGAPPAPGPDRLDLDRPDPGRPAPQPLDGGRAEPGPPDRAPPDRPPGPSGSPAGSVDGGWTGPRLAEVRAFRRRSREEDFRRVIEGLERLGAAEAAGPPSAVRLYAEGALAYVEGRHEEAATALQRLVREERFRRFWGPSPLDWIASVVAGATPLEDWQLAIGYVDPLGDLAGILERLAAGATADGGDPGWSFAGALVHRLDGEPEAVLESALPVWDRQHGDDVPAEVRSYLAELIADAYHELGSADESLQWYRRAVGAGGIHLGTVAVHAAEIARELHRMPEALGFLRQACEAGNRIACLEMRRANVRGRFPRRPGSGAGGPG